MKKLRILALVIALVMAIGLLAACGGDDNGPVTNNAGDVNEVTIGWLGPLTGGVAQFGEAVQRGVQLYIDQFNALGGLQINVIEFDDEGVATRAITGYNHLVGQGVTAIIGGVTSGPTMAVVPLGFEDNMPMITASATHANVTVSEEDGSVFTNMFRSCFIDPFQGEKMAEFAYEILEAQTAAILFSNEIAYSIGLMEAFRDRAEELGMDVVAIENFPDDTGDFRSQLTNIAQVNPDVLFVPAYIRHIALVGPQSVEVGLDTVLLGADGWAGTVDFLDDASSINGSFFLTGFSPEAEGQLIQDFIASYQARHNSMPNMFAAQGFDAAKILVEAIVRTLETTDYEPGSDPFRTAIIRNMRATDLLGVTGRITFDQFNNPQKTAVILGVEDAAEFFWGYF